MTGGRIERHVARLTLAAILLAALAAAAGCGKKGALEAPPDEKEKYTYPRPYPR